MSHKQVLIVRTSCNLDLIPPLGALHVASAIRNAQTRNDYSIKIVDCVYDRLDDDTFVELLGALAPDFIMSEHILVHSPQRMQFSSFLGKRLSLTPRSAATC